MTRAPSPGKQLDLLAGLRVLELGDGVAGASCGNILWSLGADVTAAVDPTSAHRRGRPRVGDASLLSLVLDRGKRTVPVASFADIEALLAESFDVVVFDRVGGARPELRDLGAYLAFVDERNPGAWVSISAYGLSGERATDIATELTVAAASGILATVRDPRTGNPLKIAGQQSLLNTGQAAALAACHALDLARDGAVHLDLSAVEASIATGPVLEISSVTLNTGGHLGAGRYGAPAGYYVCRDGYVRISAMEDHQWQGVVKAMGSPAWTEAFATGAARTDAPGVVDAQIEAWTRTITKGEAETLLQAHGVPATGMYSPAEILASTQLAHRDAFEALPVGGGAEATIVAAPFRALDARRATGDAPNATGATTRSLRGLRVLEAGHVLAGPLAGALLGAMGAEVTKVEDLRRLDMYRRRPPYIDGVVGQERSAYFAYINHSKRGVAFDLDADPQRLAALIADTDVVIENLGSKRATALGVAASSVVANHPAHLALSSSGFGQDGPLASYRAYAYNLQASCGFCYLTRNGQGETAEVDLAWADLVSAFALATAVAAWAVGPSGNGGGGFDYAMADLISGHFNEFIAAASLMDDSDDVVDRGNELEPYAPHGVFATEDGWIAIAVDGAEQRARLDEVLGGSEITEAVATWPAGKLADTLRAAGLAAEEVLAAARLVDVPQLVSRDFFTEVEHPEWGRRRIVGLPWRPHGGPPVALGPAPTLGVTLDA